MWGRDHRLEPHTTHGFRFAALSATLGDLNAAARWLRPDAPERVTVLKDDAETKAIRYRVHAYWNKLKAATTSPDAAAGRKRPLFVSGGGEIHSRVAQEMRDVLFSENAFAYLDESAREMLAQAQQTARDAGLNTNDLIATSDSSCLWFPWTGSSALTTLSLIAEYAGLAIPEVSDRLSIGFKSPAIDVVAALRLAIAAPPAPQQLAQRLLNKQRRKYDQFVGETLLDRSLAHDIIDIPEAVTCLQRLTQTFDGYHRVAPVTHG